MSDEKHVDCLEIAETIIETKKITNLNPDCMETIFEHLEFYDLLSVADSCTHFYDSVCQVYKKKYSNITPIFQKNNRSR